MRLVFRRYSSAYFISAGGCKITQNRAMKTGNYQQKSKGFSLSEAAKDKIMPGGRKHSIRSTV
jgi:hypothetical protein